MSGVVERVLCDAVEQEVERIFPSGDNIGQATLGERFHAGFQFRLRLSQFLLYGSPAVLILRGGGRKIDFLRRVLRHWNSLERIGGNLKPCGKVQDEFSNCVRANDRAAKRLFG